MPKIYKRNCNLCNNYYEGQGIKFCSRECYSKSDELKFNSGRFKKGQIPWIKGKKHTKEQKKKQSEFMKGRHHSSATEFKKGHITWNKGKIRLEISGKNHWKYKGTRQSRYIFLYMPEHPYAKRKYCLLSRYVSECYLNRFLNPEEIIHHIDNDKKNNLPENLYVFFNQSKHQCYHATIRNLQKYPEKNKQKLKKLIIIKSNII